MKCGTRCSWVIALVLGTAVAPVAARAQSELAGRLKQLYPNTTFDAVAPSPVKGWSEVVMGPNVAYVDESGRYFVFGRLYDMREQRDLTAERIEQAQKVDFGTLPFDAAIVTVRGNGARTVAVFSDPDCPYCRAVERELAQLDDITVYTFLYPLERLHPGAREKSIAVWCAADRAKAWADLMLRGVEPQRVTCAHPIERNLALGERLRVQGTPTLFSRDGRRAVGTQPAGELDAWLRLGARLDAGAGR